MTDYNSMLKALQGNRPAFGVLSPGEEAEIPLNPAEEAHRKAFGNLVESPIHTAKAIGRMMDEGANVPLGLRREDYTDNPNAPQPQQGLADASMEAATGLMGMGMPGAQKGAAGIFGGVLSKTADHEGLQRAQLMLARGAPAESVWKATGWYHNPMDMQWRNEISDNLLKVDPHMLLNMTRENASVTAPAASLFSHPRLFDAYPQLKDVETTLRIGPQEGVFWNGPKPTMTLQAPSREELRKVGAHELQHAVQNIEDFAMGGTPSEMAKILEADLRRTGDVGKYNFSEMEKSAHDAYQRLAGEAEARNTATRQAFGPIERIQKTPWATQDVPFEQQIPKNWDYQKEQYVYPERNDSLIRALMGK